MEHLVKRRERLLSAYNFFIGYLPNFGYTAYSLNWCIMTGYILTLAQKTTIFF